MRQMANPYWNIRKRHKAVIVKWVARIAFGPDTLRMFERGSASKLREFVLSEIGDGKWLRALEGREEFDEELNRIIASFPRSVRRHKKSRSPTPSFGQKAKVVNLYFKALVTQREPLERNIANRIQFWLHVPLDSRTLQKVWEHFEPELKRQRVKNKKQIELATLKRKDYQVIQHVLGCAARKVRVPPIWFDDYFTDPTIA